MYEYISGKVDRLSPTEVVVDVAGIGYQIKISLQTYAHLEGLPTAKLLIHFVVREDAHLLYGFFNDSERQLFRLLLSVNGVGANTAQMMLSSLSSEEIELAILSSDVGTLKAIKGIGAKTAQRIIVDLIDKVGQQNDDAFSLLIGHEQSSYKEAESALMNLGFQKKQVEKVLRDIVKDHPEIQVEELIKTALKRL
ncbi:MAG: Holliday junction branch migration protein RuvA [Bacteroidales bacterium]|nr:Holliday junction branch migration protein RuvA [Bacteroidales bacterium]